MLTALRDLLTTTARALGVEGALHLARVCEVWEDVVGPLASGAAPVAVRRGVLEVACRHPAVAHELRMRQGEVLEALRRRLPGAPLTALRPVVRLGS